MVRLSGGSLKDADLSAAKLVNAKVTAADLWRANLKDVSLCKADLTGADRIDTLVANPPNSPSLMKSFCGLQLCFWHFCIGPLLVCRQGKTHQTYRIYGHRDHPFCN